MGNLSPEIIEKFLERKLFKSKQAVRNYISHIKIRECPHATQNAAAQVAAMIKGFSIRLKIEDKKTLPPNISEIIARYKKINQTEKHNVENHKKIKYKEINPPYGKEFIDEANTNSKIYPYIYILENNLRKLIIETFRERKDWWNNKFIVHKDIQEYAKTIQEAEKKYKWLDKRGNHPIYYIGLQELFKIIEINWQDFKNTFKDLGNLRTWINESIPIRNLVAHNVKIQREEQENIRIRTKYICTLIEHKD